MFNTGTLVVPSQAEGNPFYSLVEDVQRDEESGIIKMKLDKAKILGAESRMSSFLKDLIQITQSSKKRESMNQNELLKLVQVARESSETLLMLGIGLPVGLADTVIGSSSGGREDQIDLDLATVESNEVLKRNIGLQFNVKDQAKQLIEIANMSQARKREKEQSIKALCTELDDHLAKCHVMLHLKDQ